MYEQEKTSKQELEFYGERYQDLLLCRDQVQIQIDRYAQAYVDKYGRNPIEHIKTRIKTVPSMKAKLSERKLAITLDNALEEIKDAVGIRVICTFINDIYDVVDWLKQQSELEVIEVKDYIRYSKPNGYRSYHVIAKLKIAADRYMYAEIQIRTIAMDCWASLEHQLKYKKDIDNQGFLVRELKRCADEIASTDISLQTLKDLILEED